MRFPRALGVACLFALAATLAVGAGSASAKRLTYCGANEELCKGPNLAGEALSSEAEVTFDFGGAGTIHCTSSMTQAEMGRIDALSFSGCSEGCTVKANGLPYSGSYSSLAGGNATFTFWGLANQVTLAVKCKTAECVYTSSPFEAAFEGGEPARLFVGQTLTEKEKNFFCPESMFWEALYEATSPVPAYVTYRMIEGPAFCTSNLEFCPQASIVTNYSYTLTKFGMVVGNFTGGGAVSCAEGFFLIQDEEREPEGPWRYKTGTFGKCTSATYTSCEAHYSLGPYEAALFPAGGGNGTIVVEEGFGKEQPTLEVGCTYLKKPFKCRYRTPEFELEFEGGAAGIAYETAIFERLEGSEAFCAKEVTLVAEYFTSYLGGTSLYLTEAEA